MADPRTCQMSEPPLRAAIIPVTPLQQNCCLIWCTKTMRGAFIDPGGDLDRLQGGGRQAGVTIEKILLTHGHIDHCGSAGILAEELGVPIEGPHEDDRFWIARLDEDGARYGIAGKPFEPDRWLVDGDTVTVGELTLRRPPLPRPHARPCRLPPSGIEARHRRRRAVPGLDRPHRLPAGQPPGSDRFDHRSASGRWATTPPSSPATARCRPSARSAPTNPFVGDRVLAAPRPNCAANGDRPAAADRPAPRLSEASSAHHRRSIRAARRATAVHAEGVGDARRG